MEALPVCNRNAIIYHVINVLLFNFELFIPLALKFSFKIGVE